MAIGRSDNFVIGTHIGPLSEGDFDFKDQQMLAINSHKEVHQLNIKSKNREAALEVLKSILDKARLPWPHVLSSDFAGGQLQINYTGDNEFLAVFKQVLAAFSEYQNQSKILASVTATFFKSVSRAVAEQMATALNKIGIAVEITTFSDMSVTFFIPSTARDQAVHELHSFINK